MSGEQEVTMLTHKACGVSYPAGAEHECGTRATWLGLFGAAPDIDLLGETCGHSGRDFEGNCFGCGDDERIRKAKAEAWDEGFMDAASQDHPAYPRTRRIDNPYLRTRDADHNPREEADKGARVHNHPPYRPVCAERQVNGQLRGACLNDDGTARPGPTATSEESR